MSGASAHADVAVIGAGPAGAAVALALACAGRRVLLAERNPAPRPLVGESVAPSIRLPLERLGVWQEFEADGHLPSVGNLSAWGGAQPAARDFLFSPYGNGWHLDRPRFDAMLRRRAQAAGAALHCGAQLRDAERSDGRWRLRLDSAAGPLEWSAPLVVDASGRAAALARRVGSARRPLDHLVGAVSHYACAGVVPAQALVEADCDGWWYSAPLPQRRLVLVYMSEAGHLDRRGLLAAAGGPDPARAPWTAARLARHGGAREAAPAIVPAYSACLPSAAGAHWLAVGDAAASFDPLSSQGISTALEQGLAAAEALDAALDGDHGAMHAYAHGMATLYADYLVQRTHYYRRERRWPASHFWRQRWISV